MPIEVRQLVIRANVSEELSAPEQKTSTAPEVEQLRKEIIEECMEKVKELLDKKNQR